MNRWHVLVGVLVVLLGSGCSVKFTYNNLDRFARWGVSDYLAMTDAQRRYFDAEFAKLHHWHRMNHLPQYAATLEALPVLVADGVDAEEVVALEGTMMGWADEVETRAMPMFIEMLRSLTDEQVARLPKLLEASNQEVAEPELGESLEASQRLWADDVADMFARFAGRPTEEQRQYLASQSVRYLPERALWADYRRRWQAQLLLLLERRSDARWFTERITQLAENRETYYGAELSRIFDHNEALAREVGAWLLNHMTDRQQERLFDRLLEVAADFRELAGQAQGQVEFPDACLLTC